MTNSLGDLRPGESVVIDFEKDGTMPTVAQRDQAAALFETRYGRSTMLYDNSSTDEANPTSRPVWVAAYGGSEPSAPHLFWQFTVGRYSSGSNEPINWPGCGYCDSSVFHGSAQQLAEALGSADCPSASHPQPNAAGVPADSPPVTPRIGSTPFRTFRFASTSLDWPVTATWDRLRWAAPQARATRLG